MPEPLLRDHDLGLDFSRHGGGFELCHYLYFICPLTYRITINGQGFSLYKANIPVPGIKLTLPSLVIFYVVKITGSFLILVSLLQWVMGLIPISLPCYRSTEEILYVFQNALAI